MVLDFLEQDKPQLNDTRDVLVRVEHVSKRFCRSLKKSLWYGVQDISSELIGRKSHTSLRDGEFWAVNDVSFELRRGECLGLLGRNGAGKSTLLRMLNGLIKPDRGRIETNGQVAGLIALGAGFNPILTGRENIYIYGSVLGFAKQEIDAKFGEIVEFAELEKYIDTPVQSYSSGMHVRLGFAVAVILLNPDILILDEVLAVGDRAFRAKCMIKVTNLLENAAVIFVSHQENLVQRICNRALWLETGKVRLIGEIENVLPHYIQSQRNENLPPAKLQHSGSMLEVTARPISSEIQSGQDLYLLIKLLSSAQEELSMIRVVISDEQGTLVSRSDLDCNIILEPELEKCIQVSLDKLLLRGGNYNVIVVGISKGVRKEVFTLIEACTFQVNSKIYTSIPYLPLGKVLAL
ncbi:MAG: ABC transporter ATP-binding protein [Cyanothece sp. SIO1E1]|nr:ABC transporter ATP-binding protein [Cyanothece sp. SIO1E1]